MKKTKVFVELPESRSFLDTATMPMMLTAVGVALFMMVSKITATDMLDSGIASAYWPYPTFKLVKFFLKLHVS
uniref:Uncharacterized protein n=1 Tax=Chenopodium quinoa TaxID=63459 RepID=A0A803MC84_CHEQI